MARARNLKPSLFKNEILGVADPLLTILFEGLWCLADREGRLEDRPLRIKAEIFPYRENLDINRYLTELSTLGFIKRYQIDGIALIWVVNFNKHQNPHKTERDSELPVYSDSCEITVKDTLNNGTSPADSLLPLTDSLCISNTTYSHPKPSVVGESCPYQKIVELYHTILPNHPRVRELTAKRRSHIKARWSNGMEKSLSEFEGYFNAVQRSKFLTGKVDPPPGRKRFIADFDFLMSERGYIGILEGKYE